MVELPIGQHVAALAAGRGRSSTSFVAHGGGGGSVSSQHTLPGFEAQGGGGEVQGPTLNFPALKLRAAEK